MKHLVLDLAFILDEWPTTKKKLSVGTYFFSANVFFPTPQD
jgi:hypothetical protein